MIWGYTPTADSAGSMERNSDPFSFSENTALVQGLTAWTALWAAPWKAAMVVAEEALRESGRSNH